MRTTAWVLIAAAGLCLAFTAQAQAGKAGIWKSQDPANNFYIQTYDTGSCLVIVTETGSDFYVFLDPECEDEIVASDYFGRAASLDLRFTGPVTAVADLDVGGTPTAYSLIQVFKADCRNGGPDSETITNSLGMTFVYVYPGTFTMGSPDSELGRNSDELQHQVTLTQGFYMQTTEVTQGQWKAVMGSNPSYFTGCGDDCPVEWVSWEDAQGFITGLNAMEEGTYRLPTEAEWEYAARAGTDTAFASGPITDTGCEADPNLDPAGWYCHNSSDASHAVGGKNPNAWGLYDMHGNVWEWCHDWSGEYPAGPAIDPTGPSSGSVRVYRGGSWGSGAERCRSASRFASAPTYRHYSIGFRLVCTAP